MKKCTLILTLFLASCVNAYAFDVVGKLPPPTHTVELGTYTAYASPAGSLRYFQIDETSICSGEFKLLQIPSKTYSVNKGGTYKYWKSPSGTRTPYPVAFTQECQIPGSEEPNTPTPPQPINFIGLHRVSINPIWGDAKNDCTYAEFEVTAKTSDGKYIFKFIRLYDAATTINGVRTCEYN